MALPDIFAQSGKTPKPTASTVVTKAPADTATTTISQLPENIQKVINTNAASQGLTGQQYLESRGGVNPVTGFYGDAPNAKLLTDAEYLAARSGTSGLGSGAALNKAYAKKTFDNAIAAIPPKSDNENQETYDARVAAAKEKAKKEYDNALSGSAGATGGAGGVGGGTDGTGVGGTEGFLAKQETDRIAEQKRREGQSAYDILVSEFTKYGLQSLVEPLKSLITSGASSAQFSLELQNRPEYQKRFAANKERINKGLSALSPAEYIALEDQYQNVMRNYGLPASYYTKDPMGTQQGFEKFLAADVSATELEDRIMTAQTRVINANSEVTKALKQFYPDITNGDILAYALNPQQGLSDIKRKVTAAEIGGAAMIPRDAMGNQILTTSQARAEQLAGYGVDKAQATQGFATIGGGLQRGSQLASIYGEDPYTQTTAESEVFNIPGATEARKQRQKITGLEKATFGGQTGISQGALARDRAGAY